MEKSIDNAGEDSQARGIAVENPTGRHRYVANIEGSTLQTYLAENRIIVERAPLGMQRQKVNQTRVSGRRKNVIWTVEWVLPDGSRHLSDDSMGSDTILECFERFRASLRKPDTSAQQVAGNKRKRARAKAALRKEDRNSSAQLNSTSSERRPDGSHPTDQAGESKESQHPSQPSEAQDSDASSAESIQNPSDPQPSKPLSFYFLKPKTTSKSPVLIPLEPETILTKALQDRLVQEFPTIYALHHPPDGLPADFVLEEEYLKTLPTRKPTDWDQSAALGAAKGDVTSAAERDLTSKSKELDADSILEMLKRDVSR